jgi:two-component system chemotaxis response regulator CheY
MRVMIVDECKLTRNIQRNVLALIGWTDVIDACDGYDALSKIDAFRPDLILCGAVLPYMDGLSFVRVLRSRGRRFRGDQGDSAVLGFSPHDDLRDTPVIMVSDHTQRTKVIEAIEAGVNGYIIKPFTPELLIARIRETLAKARLEQV